MSDRHEILADTDFWLTLEFGMSGWFRDCGDPALSGCWCDGFIPESVKNTKTGIVVTGTAWLEGGRRPQSRCMFAASIPQKMLSRRRSNVIVTDLVFDGSRDMLSFTVAPAPVDMP